MPSLHSSYSSKNCSEAVVFYFAYPIWYCLQTNMGNRGERRNSITETEIEDKADVYLNDRDHIEVHVVKGDFTALPEKVKEFIAENVSSFLNKYLVT